MSAPRGPRIFDPNSKKEQKKKELAQDRARNSNRANRGVAANILASADTFGSGSSARSGLGGGGLLG